MLRQRVITASILFLLFLACVFLLPAPAWALLAGLMVMQGASEWVRLSQMQGRTSRLFWWATLVLMALLLWGGQAGTGELFSVNLVVYLISACFWLLVAPFWMWMGWQVRHPLLMALVGWAVLLPTGLALVDLREYSPWLLLGIMALVWIADIAAYFAGRRFGKRKLAPSISPGKTWEGVIGAVIAVSACVLLAWSLSEYSGMLMFLPNILIASWCWVGLAVMGDLFESAIKRQAGLKDSGALLPGHGGLLDRIDALTSTLPLAALALLIQKIL